MRRSDTQNIAKHHGRYWKIVNVLHCICFLQCFAQIKQINEGRGGQSRVRVLKLGQERAWYDAHREQILRGDDGPGEAPASRSSRSPCTTCRCSSLLVVRVLALCALSALFVLFAFREGPFQDENQSLQVFQCLSESIGSAVACDIDTVTVGF